MQSKLAQVSIEWLISIGTIFLIFIFVLGYTIDKRIEVIKTESYANLRDTCIKLSEIIMSSFLGGNGTNIQLLLLYNASIDQGNQLITVSEINEASCSLPTSKVNNATLQAGIVSAKNVGNLVVIQNG